jgi:hypothetical protein
VNRFRLSAPDVMWSLLGVFLLGALFVPPSPVGSSLGLRSFLTPEVNSRWRVAQRFRMDTADLSRIEFQPQAVGPVSGRYRLTLIDRATSNRRVADVAAADLVRRPRYTFVFDPLADSRGHEFELEIASASSTDAGQGVALWATKGNRLDHGSLLINARPRWASLAFRTGPSPDSLFRALMQGGDPDRPPRWLAVVGLLASWVALRFALDQASGTKAAVHGASIPRGFD